MRNYDKLEVFLKEADEGKLTYDDGKLFRNGRELKGFKQGKGEYLAMHIQKDGKRYKASFHIIIFAMHHGLDELKKHETIDHKDGNKYNNRIDNLRGMSRFENSKKDAGGKLSVEDARIIKRCLAEGHTITSLARRFNVSNTTISKIKRGLRFKYV